MSLGLLFSQSSQHWNLFYNFVRHNTQALTVAPSYMELFFQVSKALIPDILLNA